MLNNDKKSLYLILLALNKLIIEYNFFWHFISIHYTNYFQQEYYHMLVGAF
jgi:hypothetical protein